MAKRVLKIAQQKKGNMKSTNKYSYGMLIVTEIIAFTMSGYYVGSYFDHKAQGSELFGGVGAIIGMILGLFVMFKTIEKIKND